MKEKEPIKITRENPKRSWKYDIIHEVCHKIIGYSCCREHIEFQVHGAAVLLCELLQIDIGDAEERMDCYAGCSSHEACPRCEGRDVAPDTKKNS